MLRDVVNPERRSIITPLGKLTYKRHGIHVAVRASSTTEYARFGIDNVLGRLSCPPEPRLLYSKAQFYAFTLFVLPDPLTGRTGTEEALYILKSGYCQPWTPISDSLATILKVIGKLSPSREYYPKDKRRLQTVTWDQALAISVQHDSYEGLVQEILAKSDRLRAFTAREGEEIDFKIKISSHLRRRGEIRRRLYERGMSDPGGFIESDIVYRPRDRKASLPQAANVYQIVGLFRKRPFRAYMSKELAAILQGWKLIGGFHQTNTDSENISNCLSDFINNNIGEQWGSLVNLCRHTDPEDPYTLILRLCLLSFGPKPDMDAIRSLVAFGCVDGLKILEPPTSPCFADFMLYAFPTLESLLNLIAATYPSAESNPRKSIRDQVRFQENYRILCEAEGRRLASFLLEQWPSSELSVEGFESTVLNGELALERILLEWQRLHRNIGLSEYVIQAQKILDRYNSAKDTLAPRSWNEEPTAFYTPKRDSTIPSLSDLLVKCLPLPPGHLSYATLLSKDLPASVNSPSAWKNTSPKTTLS